MSRTKRPQVGLDIVCRDHPDEILFRPRMNPETREMWNSGGSPTVALAYVPDGAPSSDYKLARRCPRLGENGERCRIAPEFQRAKVHGALLALAQYAQYGPGWRRVWTVTDQEMEHLATRPARAVDYLSARVARFGQ